jgi:opacity protein-like surface antigen
MNQRLKRFWVLISFLFLGNHSYSQFAEIGLGGGIGTYWGDLNGPELTTNLQKNSGAAFRLSYRRFYTKRIALQAAFTTASVKGADANSSAQWMRERNLSFHSNITELALTGEFYILGYDTRPKKSAFCPYISGGFSAFRFNPKTFFRGREVTLQPLGTEGQGMPGFDKKYSLAALGITAGGGAKFIINPNINIGGEIMMRQTTTDYIDDLSTKYVNYNDLRAGNGALAADVANRMNEYLGQAEPVILATGANRGGPEVKDYYFMTVVTINIKLDKGGLLSGVRKNKVTCPEF